MSHCRNGQAAIIGESRGNVQAHSRYGATCPATLWKRVRAGAGAGAWTTAAGGIVRRQSFEFSQLESLVGGPWLGRCFGPSPSHEKQHSAALMDGAGTVFPQTQRRQEEELSNKRRCMLLNYFAYARLVNACSSIQLYIC